MRPIHLVIPVLMWGLFAAGLSAAATVDFPIWIELEKPQLVTVVIEDAQGVRVRNLVAEMPLPAGKNRLSWDGYNDGTRNTEGDLVRTLVTPGTYRARGLTHDGIKLVYEFTPYSGGNPPWPTKDQTGGWLADHSSPLGAVFLPAKSGSPYGDGAPQVLLTALVAEAGSPLVWVGLDGQTLKRRQVWGWDGAIAATCDIGKTASPDYYAYLVMAWEKKISIRGLKPDGSGTEVITYTPDQAGPREPRSEGHSLAVHNGLLVFNAPTDERLIFADVATKKILGTVPMPKPRGLLFDANGRLLVISDGRVLSYRVNLPTVGADGKPIPLKLDQETVIVGTGLENPRTLASNPTGSELYIADWGKSHQVKVFTPQGKALRVIGKPSDGSQLGLYDESKMQAPLGLAVDDRDQLWVAEASHLPKRISLWNTQTGAFIRAHYGPPRYGGGGTIDPADKTRMFYQDYYGLIEFALDWKTGTTKPYAICVNGSSGGSNVVAKYGIEYGYDEKGGPSRWGFVNERPVHVGGRTYLTGSWQGGLRGNNASVTWLLGDDHVAWPVSRIGGGSFSWPPQLNQHFTQAQTATAQERKKGGGPSVISWTDLNGNHQVDADEYVIRQMPADTYKTATGETRSVSGIVCESVFSDLSMTANWGLSVPAPTIDAKGLPIYDLAKAEFLLPPDELFHFDEQFHWGTTTLPMDDGMVVTGFTGWKNRKKVWTYPVSPDMPPMLGGEVVHPTRLLGPPAKATAGEAGSWFAMNGEKGNIFLMTGDGLYLQTLGGDMRNTPLLRLPKAERGMVIDQPGQHVSFEDEHFHPTITTTDQGEIYLVAGKEHSSIFRVDGFASVKRRELAPLTISAAALAALPPSYVIASQKQARRTLLVETGGADSIVDGKLGEYGSWAAIGQGGARAGAVRLSATHLYAAWRTGDPACLDNTGGEPKFLFKRGGCVDLMMQTDITAERHDGSPIAGDVRLLVTTVKGKPKAVLYKAVVPGTPAKDRVLFESPVGAVWLDAVVDVSDQLTLAQIGGDVEIGIPLKVLGLQAKRGDNLRGDLGILRGDGQQTIQRLYWNNLDTLIVSDIPSEARLAPANWGIWKLSAVLPPQKPTAEPKAVEPGLQCAIYKGNWEKAPDFNTLKSTGGKVVPQPTFEAATTEKTNVGLVFTGLLRIPTDGLWTLTTTSDDGSLLWLGNTLVVDNDGSHGPQDASGLIQLTAGSYPIRIAYFQGGGGGSLDVRWSGPGVTDQKIPASAFFHAP